MQRDTMAPEEMAALRRAADARSGSLQRMVTPSMFTI